MGGNWTVENWGERNGRPDACLHDEKYERTLEITAEGDLAIEIDHDYNAPRMTAAVPLAQVIHLLTLHGYRVVLPGGRPASPSSDTAGKERP
jgi:hypothetical protein